MVAIASSALGLCAQDYISVRGSVFNLRGEMLQGANVLIKNSFTGTSTDAKGAFVLKIAVDDLPIDLQFSYLGYNDHEIAIDQEERRDLVINLIPKDYLGNEIIFSASRIPERILQAPVTVDRVQADEIAMRSAPELHNSLAHHPSIDVASSSMLINNISTRGFGSSGVSRMVQLVDNVDIQLPSLGLNFGNMTGAPELDINVIEIVHGPASSLYGANAFNGLLHTKTKDPFYHEGTSLDLKIGQQALFNLQARVAKKVNNFFAFKINASVLRATDWLAENQTELNLPIVSDSSIPVVGLNRVNSYGDKAEWVDSNGNGSIDSKVILPGWTEEALLDGDRGTSIIRLYGMASYIVSDKLKVIGGAGLNIGSGILQSFSRFRIKNYRQSLLRLDFEGGRWAARIFSTSDNAGDSYDLNTLGENMLREPVGIINGQSVENLEQYYIESLLSTYQNSGDWDLAAASAAAIIPQPGESLFDVLRTEVRQSARQGRGARLDFGSTSTDLSAQYDFDWERLGFIVGGSYRRTALRSNGVFFSDTTGQALLSTEGGIYTNLKKEIATQLHFTFSGRIDFFNNFDSKISPRVALVWSADKEKKHNFRWSYGRSYRSPSKLEQFLFLSRAETQIIGNVGNGFAGFTINESSVEFDNQIAVRPLDLERIDSYELGYKNQIGKRFNLDLHAYYNFYNDFIYRIILLSNPDGSLPTIDEGEGQLIQTWTNSRETIETFGAAINITYQFRKWFSFRSNLSYNTLLQEDNESSIAADQFNTPKYRYNIGASGIVNDKYGYRINYRYSEGFFSTNAFASGEIPDITIVDFALSYQLSKYRTKITLTGNNILNSENFQVFGSASIGRMILLGATVHL